MKLSLALLPPVLIATLATRGAHGAESPRAEEVQRETFRAGVLGGVGFPRPLGVEGFVRIERVLGAGFEYAAMPSATIYGVHANLWSLAGDLRVFPLSGAFFVGVRVGLQHFDASTSINMGVYGTAHGALALDTWFINPRLGFLWVSSAGFALGMDAGVQIPVSSSQSSNVPPAMASASGVNDVATIIGRTALPTVDLLKVGILF
jgi:hypothetical protein